MQKYYKVIVSNNKEDKKVIFGSISNNKKIIFIQDELMRVAKKI